MGWSNGGYLTNCLITLKDSPVKFKAASSGAGIVDTVAEWGFNDEPAYPRVFKKGLPWETPDIYRKTSPTYGLGNVTTPTLIHVGGSDERCPPGHSRMLYRALKEYVKVPTELVVYPGEPHGLTKLSQPQGEDGVGPGVVRQVFEGGEVMRPETRVSRRPGFAGRAGREAMRGPLTCACRPGVPSLHGKHSRLAHSPCRLAPGLAVCLVRCRVWRRRGRWPPWRPGPGQAEAQGRRRPAAGPQAHEGPGTRRRRRLAQHRQAALPSRNSRARSSCSTSGRSAASTASTSCPTSRSSRRSTPTSWS